MASDRDNSAVSIRQAREADALAITRIYNQSIAARIATFDTMPRDVVETLARIAEPRLPQLVAETDSGLIAGWAGLSPYRPRKCYDGVAEFSVYLDHAMRGRGIGLALMTTLIERARILGYWKLLSRIFPSNSASRALCRRCGFREVGVYEKHAQLDGRWLDIIIVERCLHSTRQT